ncbi:MAG: pilus assembly protein TadG-related protein [Myxococcaceae bacterium]
MRRSRGQTLLLFAMTMLLIALMVAMTLSMGSRTKEKMELQTAADAAAWNGAVATARTFNSIAVMNRVQVAHAVSTLGTLSLISWATLYWKHTSNAAKLFQKMAAPYAIDVLFNCLPPPKPLCKICMKGLAQTLIVAALATKHASTTKNRLESDTQLFTQETTPRWKAAQQIHASQLELIDRLKQYLGPNGAAAQTLAAANLRASTEVVAPDAAAMLSAEELDNALADSMGPVAGAEPWHIGHILMASRGHPFFLKRKEAAEWDQLFDGRGIPVRSSMVFAGGGINIDASRGMSYYDNDWNTNPSGRIYGPLAHDGKGGRTRAFFVPASLQFKNWVKCNSPLPAFFIAEAIGIAGASVGMKSAAVSADQHLAIGHNVQHAFRTFPPFIDYNGAALLDEGNLYGQPRVVSMMSRDIQSKDVFELSTDFKFTSAGGKLAMGKTRTAQMAVGTGLVYYHRADHALEPPNLFAPFWRAGLTRFAVDRPESGTAAWDARTVQLMNQSGQPEMGDVYNELKTAGYGGFE